MGRLSVEDRKRICCRLIARESTSLIATEFGVSEVTVRKIRRSITSLPKAQPQRGDSNGRSKLRYADVELIRATVEAGEASQADMARKFHVSRALISRVCRGELWDNQQPTANTAYVLGVKLLNGRPEPGSLKESQLVDDVFSYYRSVGFPIRVISEDRIAPGFKITASGPSVLDGKTIKLSNRGLKLVNAFHPHIDSVRCRNLRTPMEVFGDDEVFRRAILKHIRYGDRLTAQGIRYAIYSYGGTQAASNFRPAAVKSLVEILGGGRVLDPCMGFGARLLGALSAGSSYVGIDPCRKTVEGNKALMRALQNADVRTERVTLHRGCAEDVLGRQRFGTFNVAITSPPYFDLEIYDRGPDQSTARYPEFGAWLTHFLLRLVESVGRDLRPYGYMALNVSRPLLPYVREFGARNGFRAVTVFDYELYVRQVKQSKQGRTRSEPLILMQRTR